MSGATIFGFKFLTTMSTFEFFYSFNDSDKRTANKSKKILFKKKIKVRKILVNNFQDFYQSYYAIKKDIIPDWIIN